jgi:hypothetical protein
MDYVKLITDASTAPLQNVENCRLRAGRKSRLQAVYIGAVRIFQSRCRRLWSALAGLPRDRKIDIRRLCVEVQVFQRIAGGIAS